MTNALNDISQRLRGRRAFVTGAASGIGLATVQRLTAEGASVVATDVRRDALETIPQSMGQGSVTLCCDVGDEASVEEAMRETVEVLGGLDIVVHCAGIVRGEATHALSLEQWNTMLKINLTGTFLVIKHAIPHLRNSGGGSIVTIGSVASVVAAGRTSAYDASKGGVLQFTRAVAVEYVEDGIRANCVLPGVVKTSLAATSEEIQGRVDTTTVRSPANRIRIPMERASDPAEIASVVAFLASDDASFMTGAAIAADGGYTAV